MRRKRPRKLPWLKRGTGADAAQELPAAEQLVAERDALSRVDLRPRSRVQLRHLPPRGAGARARSAAAAVVDPFLLRLAGAEALGLRAAVLGAGKEVGHRKHRTGGVADVALDAAVCAQGDLVHQWLAAPSHAAPSSPARQPVAQEMPSADFSTARFAPASTPPA